MSLLLTSCEEESVLGDDPVLLQPHLSIVSVTPETINTDTIPVNGGYRPDDMVPMTVTYVVTARYPTGLAPTPVSHEIRHAETGRVYAAGTVAGGDTVTGTVEFRVRRSTTGRLDVVFHSEVSPRLGSNTVFQAVTIIRASHAPVIFNLSAPDTVQRPPIGQVRLIPLSIAATDSDGLEDIAEVAFRNLDSPSDTNRKFFMYDDGDTGGLSGDSTAGDGIFSLVVQLPAGTSPGTFRFRYEAIDRARLGSNVIIKPLTVE